MRTHPRPGRTYVAGSPQLIAHRGGAALLPENTLAAFRSAVRDWGVDMLETDARLTKDGKVVLIHDATVDRTTDGTGPVADMTWDELSELDAGARFRDVEGRASAAGQGIRVPLLEELLEECPDVWVNVESKSPETARPLVELVRGMGQEHRVLVAAEWARTRVDAIGYPGPWGASVGQVARGWLSTKFRAPERHRPDYDILQIPEKRYGIRVVTPAYLKAAHSWNVPVHVWVVDEERDMRRLLEMGVDGIQTDRPDIGARVFTDQVGRPPAPAHRRVTG